MFQSKDQLPRCGVGLSFRPEIADAIYESLDQLDFVEVIIDNVIGGSVDERFCQQIVGRMPVVGHGVNTSLGSLEPLDRAYLARISRFARRLQCHWFSDHLAFTQSEEMEIGQLMPVQFVDTNIRWIAGKIREAQRLIGLPFLLENIAYYFTIPGAQLQEIDLLLGILAEARCGLLLDLNNLYANSLNHGYDPYAFLDRLPAPLVVEIHVAGGQQRGGLYLDSHGHPVSSHVMELLDYAIATKRPNAVLLEREKNFPPMTELVAELNEIRRIWVRHQGPAAHRRSGLDVVA